MTPLLLLEFGKLVQNLFLPELELNLGMKPGFLHIGARSEFRTIRLLLSCLSFEFPKKQTERR